jgi:hypothetical protein
MGNESNHAVIFSYTPVAVIESTAILTEFLEALTDFKRGRTVSLDTALDTPPPEH